MKFQDQPWSSFLFKALYYSIKSYKLYEITQQKPHIYWSQDRTHTKRHLRT